MASESRPIPVEDDPDLLRSLLHGGRGEALRGQLAARYPECSREAIDEAIQFACKSFLDEAEGITAPGQIYVWIRTTALRSLNREADRQHREVAVDPGASGLETAAAEEPDPAEELIALEDDAELAMLVEKVSSSLSDRGRDVLALYGAGLKRPQIADRLGIPEREVKRDLRLIMERARAIVARLSGGGCARGESLVLRFICGISGPDESDQAREHLSHCGRCESFSERLIAWRDKAGAILPAPTAEAASPGVVRHLADSAGEKLSALKHHVTDSGAQLKQQLAAATSSRTVDPTPIAGARPGTAVAVIAGCLAIGGGAAGVCVDQGVNPLGAAKSLIASTPDEKAPEEVPPADESTGPVYTPVEAAPAEEEPEPTADASPPPAAEAQQPEAKPEPKPEPKAETSAAESTFEPASASSQSTETESEASYESTEEPAPEPSPEPAPQAPASSGSRQFQP